MTNILHFASVINRHDFIDVIIRNADPGRFRMMACTFAGPANIAEPDFAGAGVPHWVIGRRRRIEYPRTVLRLARLLKRERIDILHTHHYDEAVLGYLATRLNLRTRLIVGRHYSDAVYRLTTGLKRTALLGIENTINRAAATIVAPSSVIRDILVQRQDVEAAKVAVIPYGFEEAKYAPPDPRRIAGIRKELGVNGHLAIGTFGRLHEEKGHRHLLDALARLGELQSHVRCVIVGEGPERPALEQQIRSFGLEKTVHLMGWRRDVVDLMAAVDVVVQPTLHEAFSQVMAEALWLSKPLIMTDVSGATDVIRHGDNGLIVPQKDAQALAGSIEQLCSDAALRARMGSSGRAYVEEHLTIGKVIPQYEQVYQQVLND